MRKLLPIIVVILITVAVQRFFVERDVAPAAGDPSSFSTRSTDDGADAVIARAFESRQSNLQVRGAGIVRRVLADDNEGDRHQRFILELASGQTLLVTHNIDLAPRIASLSPGDRVSFYGEYEWNDQGGVIHWTHADAAGRHAAGWLEHGGKRYQ